MWWLQVAVAMVTVQHHFRRPGLLGEQPGDVLLNCAALRHVAAGSGDDRRVWLSHEQIHRSSHVHSVHLLRRCHSASRVRCSRVRTVFVILHNSHALQPNDAYMLYYRWPREDQR